MRGRATGATGKRTCLVSQRQGDHGCRKRGAEQQTAKWLTLEPVHDESRHGRECLHHVAITCSRQCLIITAFSWAGASQLKRVRMPARGVLSTGARLARRKASYAP